ncbi:MAG: hypothetical protein CMJ48_14165 [Planctomycetaceae bacterium]|nr:hypothetical protein [Planctomycetaceae bacterium]
MGINLFMNGGGTRLSAHLGGLQALTERKLPVQAWAGASAGSLIASIMASGFTHQQIVSLMFDTEYGQFLDRRPFRMIRDFGLCSGTTFENWLNSVLEERCFKDLDVPLTVVATDISTGLPFLFSNERTPDVNIATAVRCSIGIPGVFGVRRVEERSLVDGTLTAVEANQLFPRPDDPSFLMRMIPDRSAPMEHRKTFGLAGYIRRMVEIMLRCADDLCRPEMWTHDLCITVGAHSPIRFAMSNLDKQQLYESGYGQCRRYLGNCALGAARSDRAEVIEGHTANVVALLNRP